MAFRFFGIPVVWIKFANATTAEDLALRKELSAFMWEHNIVPAVQPGGDGSDWNSHGYKPEDARKIIAWLKDHGAEVDPSVLSS
jgi:hypothetical protein